MVDDLNLQCINCPCVMVQSIIVMPTLYSLRNQFNVWALCGPTDFAASIGCTTTSDIHHAAIIYKHCASSCLKQVCAVPHNTTSLCIFSMSGNDTQVAMWLAEAARLASYPEQLECSLLVHIAADAAGTNLRL